MRRYVLAGLMAAASGTAFAAQPITVAELAQTVQSLQRAGKSDDDIAAVLKQLRLSEEIDDVSAANLRNSLGTLSAEQLTILRGVSSFDQDPTAPNQPVTAPSDMLARAAAWIDSVYRQTPMVTASKAVMRFDENAQYTTSSPSGPSDPPLNYTLTEERTDTVKFMAGAETPVSPEKRVNWGENGKVSEGRSALPLSELWQEASASGKVSFARWETVAGKTVAVFSFTVDKKKARYLIDYCCFRHSELMTADQTATGDVGLTSQTHVMYQWRPMKKLTPYHGLIYIDPVNGAILRTLTVTDLKPYEYVHVEKVRTDYAVRNIAGKECVVPTRKVTLSEVVPGGDTRPPSYPAERILVLADYGNFGVVNP